MNKEKRTRSLNEKGEEVLDPTPVSIPIDGMKPMSLQEMFSKYVNSSNQKKLQFLNEEFDEETDFEDDSEFESQSEIGEKYIPTDPAELAALVKEKHAAALQKLKQKFLDEQNSQELVNPEVVKSDEQV